MSTFRMWQRIVNRYDLATKYVATLLVGAAFALLAWCAVMLLAGLTWLALWAMTLAISGG